MIIKASFPEVRISEDQFDELEYGLDMDMTEKYEMSDPTPKGHITITSYSLEHTALAIRSYVQVVEGLEGTKLLERIEHYWSLVRVR